MRLDQLAEIEGDRIAIEWRSFLLRPEPEERDLEKFTRYTQSWERPAGIEPEAKFTTPWTGIHAPPSHSMPAAIAGKTAATFGQAQGESYHRKLLDAYFVENRTVSERSVLIEVAVEAGLDGDEFGSRFDDQRVPLAQQVIEDHNDAINSGVTGVPGVIIDKRYLVSGAVDVDHYQRVIAQVRKERHAPS